MSPAISELPQAAWKYSEVLLEHIKPMWDHPIMTVKADNKKRVVVPGAAPGDVVAFEDMGNRHFVLVRLTRPEPPAKKRLREIRAAIAASKMRSTMGWDELKRLTRDL